MSSLQGPHSRAGMVKVHPTLLLGVGTGWGGELNSDQGVGTERRRRSQGDFPDGRGGWCSGRQDIIHSFIHST